MRLPRSPVVALAALAALILSFADGAQAARGAGTLDGAYIVVLEGSGGNTDAITDELQRKRGFRARLRFRSALRGFAARLTDEQAARLRDDPAVASVTPDRPVTALGEVPAPGESVPTGVRRIGAGTLTTAREASTANVAVLDSGIDLSHPDLNAATGFNCITPNTPAQDDNGHGAHVAGTISARNNGGGVVGVAPGTRTYAVKVLNAEGRGSSSNVICGIDWVTRTRTDADPSNDVAVANLSLGGPGPPVAPCATTRDPWHMAICASTRAGVTYVVAAGNEAKAFDDPSRPDVPAAYPEVLTVTAMSDSDGAPGGQGGAPNCRPGELDDRYVSFSNYAMTTAGAAHTVAGPGACIRSTWSRTGIPPQEYLIVSGTSMASPHIAGAVALCLGEGGAAGPCAGLSPASIIARIRDVAARQAPEYGFFGDPLRPVTGRYFGHLAWAGARPAVEPEPVPDPIGPGEGGSAPPSPAPPPPVSPVPTATDSTAPTAILSVRRRRLKTVLRRGLAVALRCSEGCLATAEVWLPGRTAKRLRLSRGARVRITRRVRIRLGANSPKRIMLKLSRTARARLARVRGVTLTVRATATDSAGNPARASRSVAIRR